MKQVMIALLAALGLVAFSSSAEARGGGGGQYEFMEYVGPTDIPVSAGSDQTMALCHLIQKTHVVFIPLYFASHGYVLSNANCSGDTYFTLPAERMAEARTLGLISPEFPEVPVLSSFQRLVPWLWGAGALFIILSLIRLQVRKLARTRAMTGATGASVKLIDAMCHAAKADGNIDDREIAVIANIAEQLTGQVYPPEKIRRMADLSEKNLQPAAFVKFGKGLDTAQRELVMQAVLMVVGADGQLGSAEQKFVAGLAGGLGMTKPQFDRVMIEARAAMMPT